MSVSIGLVGLGMMGRTHLGCYADIPAAEVVALCDLEPDRLRGDQYPAPDADRTDDYAALLERSDLDAVDLCVPTHLHAEMATAALKAGKHVFCEKPIALRAEDAEGVLSAARDAGRVLMVGHVLRFWPEYLAIEQMISSGRFGRVRSAFLRRVSGPPDWDRGWYADASCSGSAALDLHIHDADVVRWWFGRVDEVCSTGRDDGRGGVRHIVSRYRIEGGPMVVAEGGWLSGRLPFAMSATVDFDEATAVYDSSASPTLRVYPAAEALAPEVARTDAYWDELAHFVDCVAAGRPPRAGRPEDAVSAVALVAAELESVRTGSYQPGP